MSMSVVPSSRPSLRRLSLEEKLAVSAEVERRQSDHALMTDAFGLPMRRWRRHVELGAGVSLGIVSGIVASLACFVLFCMFLHAVLF